MTEKIDLTNPEYNFKLGYAAALIQMGASKETALKVFNEEAKK